MEPGLRDSNILNRAKLSSFFTYIIVGERSRHVLIARFVHFRASRPHVRSGRRSEHVDPIQPLGKPTRCAHTRHSRGRGGRVGRGGMVVGSVASECASAWTRDHFLSSGNVAFAFGVARSRQLVLPGHFASTFSLVALDDRAAGLMANCPFHSHTSERRWPKQHCSGAAGPSNDSRLSG